jgi:hypothetical protein
MTNSPIIEGIPDPRKSSQLSSDDPVDPEKFKRMLKIENSEEMQKQHKRRKPKKAEEEEGPENSEDLSNTPKGASFSDIFNPAKTELDIFAKKGEKKTTTLSSEESVRRDSSVHFLGTEKSVSSSSFLKLEGSLPTAKKIESQKNFLRKPKKEPVQQIQLDRLEKSNATLEKIKESPAPVDALQKTDGMLEDKTLSTKESQESSHAKKELPSPLLQGVQIPLIPITENAAPQEESEKIGSLNKTEAHSLQKDHKEKEEEKKQESQPTIQQPTEAPIVTPPLLTTETPSYATLSANVYELFEKLVGLLMIEEHKGISITTIKLSMPGSVFNNCEIKLEHFDTAPNSFNIQLLGNPSAVDLFNANYQSLVNAMTQSTFSFKANIRRPVLLESYRHLIKRKGDKAGEDHSQHEQAS